jgi:hypothetical protein
VVWLHGRFPSARSLSLVKLTRKEKLQTFLEKENQSSMSEVNMSIEYMEGNYDTCQNNVSLAIAAASAVKQNGNLK